jgi:hypothetical protein
MTVRWRGPPDFQAHDAQIFFLLIVFINIFGSLGFAEEEFWSSVLKLVRCALTRVSFRSPTPDHHRHLHHRRHRAQLRRRTCWQSL